jgi:transposase-like protein
MGKMTKCRIISVGKRRDGGTRYWCKEHKADATAKYGKRARRCRYAHIPVITPDEVLSLDVNSYGGGVALWGAVPPIYDTTRRPIDRGIHVHARRVVGGEKEIDDTYRAVRLVGDHKDLPPEGFKISELEAIYYMVTSMFGYEMKYVVCTMCGYPHLDKDWFSIHAHRRHLCAGCGQLFRDEDTAIGNPVIRIQEIFSARPRRGKRASKSINIRQVDYPGGIQIWGSNPAILWTGSQRAEEGIHIHAAGDDDSENIIDDTFSRVTIDGVKLDPAMVRMLMAQSGLPHIANRVVDVRCPQCDRPHFDTGELAFTPHDEYVCASCGHEFRSRGRLRKTIGNPMVGILAQLAEGALRPPRQHESNLLPETL